MDNHSFTLLLISLTLLAMPAWSAPGMKPSVDTPIANTGKDRNSDKKMSEQQKSKDGKQGGGSAVKKKAVKGAGAAVATGAVTKKVTSEIKK